eukprot:2445163-Prymnesium_polylepis.1
MYNLASRSPKRSDDERWREKLIDVRRIGNDHAHPQRDVNAQLREAEALEDDKRFANGRRLRQVELAYAASGRRRM